MNKKLFSFRRCPYAIRARMALKECKINYELIEVDLKNKPTELIKISPKGTVPVLVLENQKIIDESIDIIQYALANNQESSLNIIDDNNKKIAENLIAENDNSFKKNLDKYKYHVRYPENTQLFYRQESEVFLEKLEDKFDNGNNKFLLGKTMKYVDIAIAPFIRQFCYVNEKWFRNSKYINILNWLDYLEKKMDIRQK
ncbi:glutathione S-transferase N-terminal domain-containing protein [Flavobacteriaceae bacterium]|nr:glutathione S-transferase N-terminal domain-containing protein [Flavobacteriaceae bacterium]